MQATSKSFDAQSDLRLSWLPIPHCWKSHVADNIFMPYWHWQVTGHPMYNVASVVTKFCSVTSATLHIYKVVPTLAKLSWRKSTWFKMGEIQEFNPDKGNTIFDIYFLIQVRISDLFFDSSKSMKIIAIRWNKNCWSHFKWDNVVYKVLKWRFDQHVRLWYFSDIGKSQHYLSMLTQWSKLS